MQTSYEIPPFLVPPPLMCPSCSSSSSAEIAHTSTRAWRRCRRCEYTYETSAKLRGSISVQGIVVRCYEVAGAIGY